MAALTEDRPPDHKIKNEEQADSASGIDWKGREKS